MNSYSPSPSRIDDEVTLFDLWDVVWRGKYWTLGITGVLTAIAVVYALLAAEWYRAEALLVPVQEESLSGLRDQLSGLAAIAGVSTGRGGNDSTEALAVLRSREFARAFILENKLMPVFAKPADEPASNEALDIRDAVKFFHENVLRVSEDRETGLVTLAIEWTDPELAAEWASLLAMRLNKRMRDQALQDARENIKFLQSEMANNNIALLNETISQIIGSEMQKLMLARGNEEYSFRIIDTPQPPRVRSRPRRTLLVGSVFVLSGMLSVVVVFVRNAVQRKRQPARPS